MSAGRCVAEKPQVNILIVEDGEIIAMDLEHRLRALGYHVARRVVSGRDAVDWAARELPDLVLVDLHGERERDGVETAARIRGRLGLPVILITARADSVATERAKKAHPLRYIVKPFSDRELHASIEMALDRHAMESQIRDRREWLDAILHAIGDAVIATDEDTRIRLLNPVAKRLTGWSEDEAVGHRFRDVAPLFDLDSGQPADPLSDALNSCGAPGRRRFRLRARTGVEIIVEDSTACLARGDTTGGGIFVFRDITDRLRAEQDLQGARRMEALGRLAGGVAHSFNNLLTIILGVSSIGLEECAGDVAISALFSTIGDAAQEAGELTNKMLALGRKQVLNPKLLNVNDLVRDMRRMMRPVLSEGVELEVLPLAERPFVLADRQQLEEAILNIFLNARDAVGDTGKVRVRVQNACMPEAGDGTGGDDAVAINITDTGVGIPPESIARVFEPFFSTKQDATGTGLGLATAYGIVCQSGGRIQVESQPGAGASFTILLPVHDLPEQASSTTHRLLPVRGLTARVLLVEDNDSVRRLEAKVLSATGLAVRHAPGGREALRLLRAAPDDFDLLITDVVMPLMNGAELARRALKLRPDLRILFVSGYAEDHARLAEFPPGATAFLAKPFSTAALAETVAALLKAPDTDQRR